MPTIIPEIIIFLGKVIGVIGPIGSTAGGVGAVGFFTSAAIQVVDLSRFDGSSPTAIPNSGKPPTRNNETPVYRR